jgi:hypothetical protein
MAVLGITDTDLAAIGGVGTLILAGVAGFPASTTLRPL